MEIKTIHVEGVGVISSEATWGYDEIVEINDWFVCRYKGKIVSKYNKIYVIKVEYKE